MSLEEFKAYGSLAAQLSEMKIMLETNSGLLEILKR
jgi:hypothetical protein